MSICIIAEAGVNHNGDPQIAKQLIEAAADAGCDAIKFQSFKVDDLVSKKAQKATYQINNTDSQESQYEMLKRLEFGITEFQRLQAYCEQLNIEFLSTPFDAKSADMLETLAVARYKIGSGDLTNKGLLQHVASFGKPMIISTGMANMAEISEAITWIEETGNRQISLLHCTSDYPTAYEDIDMHAMLRLSQAFEYPVGYSDHSIGLEIPVMAAALGATIIEKHITLSHELHGPDHVASLEVKDLKSMVDMVRHVEAAFGSAEKSVRDCESGTILVARKSVTAITDLKAGSILQPEDLAVKRPGDGVPPKYLDELYGAELLRDVTADTALTFEDVRL